MTDLSELTLDELAKSLREQASANLTKDADAWSALVGLANELTEGDRIDILTANRKWLLRKLTVKGFRGAKHEINLCLDNPHGLTVLFGENGSGKSSLAESVRVALEGRIGATHLGTTGGVHELWGSTDQRSQGVDTATVTLVLSDGATTDRLTICAVIDSSGVKRDGFLESQGDRVDLEAESPAWKVWGDAIRASPPVLAYAELADELQKKKDLQVWLTSCLAMDNASRIFDLRVKFEVEAALQAERLIIIGKENSSKAVLEADAEAKRQGVKDVPSLEWVDWSSNDDLNDWLKANDIVARERRDHVLDREVMSSLPGWGLEFMAAWRAWSEAATTALLTAQVTDALLNMHDRVVRSDQGDNDGVCPTCGSLHENWRGHLQEEAKKLQGAQEAASHLKNLVRDSPTKFLSPLETCLLVLPTGFDLSAVSELGDLIDEVAASQGGDDLDIELLSAIANLSKWSQGPDADHLFRAALDASGLQHEWRCNRWDAVAPFIATFQSQIDTAVKAGTLKKARSKWNSHLAKIRTTRSSQLHALVGPAVSTLLGDVGISVSAIDITKTESRLELVNGKGESVELAHLSAGQRNALILGPVIATVEAGIFGFSILDDPVHAFDDFRVDKLSSTLAQMGLKQALILTTHDARFVSYLRVHASSDISVLSTHRDQDGRMSLTATKDAPAELIDFAAELSDDLKKSSAQEGRAEIIALLRMALDEAFEQLALRHFARRSAVEAKNDRDVFDNAMLTDERKSVLRGFMADSPNQLAAFTSAWQLVSVASKRWSKAVHDPNSVPDSVQLEVDIVIADQAVNELRTIRW